VPVAILTVRYRRTRSENVTPLLHLHRFPRHWADTGCQSVGPTGPNCSWVDNQEYYAEIEIGVPPPNGPFFTNFTGSAGYDSGFNGGAPLGVQYDPWRLEEEYGTRW